MAHEAAPLSPLWAEYRARKVFGNLDGFRAISILAVVWHHTATSLDPFPGGSRGFLGVDMFFVLSGFLIVTLILRERERNGWISLKRFYMRRTLRIFPLYYAIVALVGLLCVLLNGKAFGLDLYLEMLPYLLTYTSNWGPGAEALALSVAWSLAAEEQFYLVWPPIERFLGKVAVPILIAALAYNQAFNFGLIELPFGMRRYHYAILQSTFTPILLGVALAHILHARWGFRVLERVLGSRASSIGVFVLLLVVVNIPNDDIGGAHRFGLHLLMTLFLASLVLREDTAMAPVMRWSPFVRIGRVSYGMYLMHMIIRAPAYWLLARIGLPDAQAGLFALTVACTWVAAELSFRYFEMPFLKLKARFASV